MRCICTYLYNFFIYLIHYQGCSNVGCEYEVGRVLRDAFTLYGSVDQGYEFGEFNNAFFFFFF